MKAKEAFELAKKNGYLVITESERFVDAQNAWWYYCDRNRIPFLKFVLRRKYARLHLDTESTRVYIDVEGQKKMRELARFLGAKFYMCGANGITLNCVPIEEIDSVAHWLLELCSKHATDKRGIYESPVD
jgi:hypothetical protein